MKQVCKAFFLFSLVQASLAQLSGPLSGTLGPGVFHVIDTISVEAGDSLTLLPGTIFNFDGPYPFYIYGPLLAEGTESDSVIFTTDTLTNPDRWRGLRFLDSNSSGSRLAYCLIKRSCTTGGSPDSYGGGVRCDNSSPTFMHCTISSNAAGGGGGVACDSSSPRFENCRISGNSASGGGGVACSFSAPIFTNCTLGDNSATTSGGGISSMWSCPTFTNCVINDNSAGSGGGMFYYESWSVSTNCAISGNRASYGGGVFCHTWSSYDFVNCTIDGNTAREGGGVFCSNSWPTFTRCTLSSNSADSGGGVFCEEYSFAQFNSTIVAFSSGTGIYFENSAECSVKFCDIFGNSDGPFGGDVPAGLGELIDTNANGDSCDRYYNIFLDPMFVDTVAGDYHLLAGSPCIDAGDPTLPLDPDSTIADIGAFYYHQSAAEPFAVLLPEVYRLHPNWPNPFNSATMIRYDVPQAGKVSVTIFNLLGQRVATLFDGRQLAGSYTISWEAANLPSGVYLCRMEAAGFAQTRKMLLVK